MIMNFPPYIRIAEDLAGSGAEVALPLGSIEFVREALSIAFPGIDWSDPAWGVWTDESGATVLHANLGGADAGERRSIMLSVDGDGSDAVIARAVAAGRPLGWKVIDTTTRAFVSDPEYDAETRAVRNQGDADPYGGILT